MKISKLLFFVLLTLMKNKFLLVALAFLSAISTGTAADLTSGGLGLSRQSWEAKHGKPDSKCPINSYTCYDSTLAIFHVKQTRIYRGLTG